MRLSDGGNAVFFFLLAPSMKGAFTPLLSLTSSSSLGPPLGLARRNNEKELSSHTRLFYNSTDNYYFHVCMYVVLISDNVDAS